MTADQFRKDLNRIGLTQVGAARLFDYNERTVRHWAAGKYPVPRIISIVLWLMVRFKIKPDDLPS